jgi:hypothetical protein
VDKALGKAEVMQLHLQKVSLHAVRGLQRPGGDKEGITNTIKADRRMNPS